MDLDFDKFCVVDGSPKTVLIVPRSRSRDAFTKSSGKHRLANEGKRLQKFFAEISFNRFRSASSRGAQLRRRIQESSEGLKRGSQNSRKKIEISSESASAFSLGVIDSLCSSDEDSSIRERNMSSLMSISEQSTSSFSENQMDFTVSVSDMSEKRHRDRHPSVDLNKVSSPKLAPFAPPDYVGSKTSQFFEESHNLFSPAHLHGLLKVENRKEEPIFVFSVKSFEGSYVARSWKADNASSWLYTFHNLRVRRRGNSGRWGFEDKRKRDDVVGWMLVRCYFRNEQDETGAFKDSMVTECVLYNTDLSSQPLRDTKVYPGLEIGAIVMEVPSEKRESLEFRNNQHLCQHEEVVDGFCDSSRPRKIYVVIPSGNHSLPSDESSCGPSSLLDRWRSGGGCDCGGWDMACPLDVFANLNFQISSEHPSQLFAEGREAKTPAFSMHSVDDENYAVDFHAKLTAVQALSICVAMRDLGAMSRAKSRRALRSNSVREYAEENGAVSEEEELKTLKKVFPSVVLNPPFSPIARV